MTTFRPMGRDAARACARLIGCAAVASALAAATLAAPARAEITTIEGIQGSGSDLTGIATDSQSRAWVAEDYAQRVRVFAPDGSLVRSYPMQPWPEDVAPLPDGSFVVSYNNDAKVVRYGADGSVMWSVAVANWIWKHSLVLTTDGRLFSQHHLQVYEIDPANGMQLAGGFAVAENDKLVSAGPDGTLLVSFSGSGLREVAPDGTVVKTIDTGGGATGATAPDGSVFVSRAGQGEIRRQTSGGSPSGSIVAGEVLDMAVAPDGALWALEGPELRRIEPDVPIVSLDAPKVVSTGDAVTLDTSATLVPFGSIASTAFDLDGNGSFESSSGSAAYATPGVRHVRARLTSTGGVARDAAADVDVRLRSPDGLPGASINQGAQFTNDPHVQISLRWPMFAQNAVVANDGGFFSALAQPVTPTLAWTLDSSGPERLPKTIYVRFTGGTSGPETYQDDIILDQTAPVVEAAAVDGAAGAARASASRALTLTATDATSGVAMLQTQDAAGHPSDWQPFASRVSFTALPAQVRVRDAAGNASAWRRTKVSAAKRVTLKPRKTVKVRIVAPDTGTGARYTLAVKRPHGIKVLAKKLDKGHRRFTVRLRNKTRKKQRVTLTATSR